MTEQYDVVVIGGGAAGLSASAFAGELGKKVALVERERLGGDCTWAGCVPSKALLKVAKVAHAIRTAKHYGIAVDEPTVDMKIVRDHLRDVVAEVYRHETPEVFTKRGVDVICGEAHFIDPHTVQVSDQRLTARKIIIATGGRPFIPPIPELDSVPYKTNRNLFDNDRLPKHLLIIGAGPIGMEMAQAYARLGAEVTVVGEAILPRDEPEAVRVIRNVFAKEGIQLVQTRVVAVRPENHEIVLSLKTGDDVRGDMLLAAAGRVPDVDALDLEKAGVVYAKHGIKVNRRLQTNVPHIYAIGDCAIGPKFTHYAGFQGAAAGRNVVFPFGKANGHDADVPWVTFTDPELAHVGMTEAEARQKYGASVKVFNMPLSQGDRAVAENDTEGMIKLVYRGSQQLLGATVVSDRAGEMITEYTLAIKRKVSLRTLLSVIHPYPTYSDIVRKSIMHLMVGGLFSHRTGQWLKKAVRLLP